MEVVSGGAVTGSIIFESRHPSADRRAQYARQQSPAWYDHLRFRRRATRSILIRIPNVVRKRQYERQRRMS